MIRTLGARVLFAALVFGVLWLPASGGAQPKRADDKDPPPASDVTITGSGSTFIKPAMEFWSEQYAKKTGVKIAYTGIGSGRGVLNMIDKVSDFGCTDAFMTDNEIKKAKSAFGEVIHVPLAMGAVVVTYNLEGMKEQLKLTGPVLVKIYLGEITSWNDKAITDCNPDAKLPDLEITVVRRTDPSPTTALFTEYLSKVSSDWEKKVGSGITVKWPELKRGENAEKNDGAAKAVSKKNGSIGYVELSFALEAGLKFAQVKNSAGKYINPSLKSVTAAADASLKTIKNDLRYSLIDAPGDDSYPLVGTTWLVVYADQIASKEKGKELVKFLEWAVTDGQEKLNDLRYAPLPEKLAEFAKKRIALIQTAK